MLKNPMMKLLSAAALIGLAGPALANPPHWAPDHGRRDVHRKVVVVEHRYHRPVRTVVVQRPVYVTPAPVFVRAVQTDYEPAPAYGVPSGTLLGTLGGAAIGAAVGSQIGQGRGNTAAIAVGAVLGGMIGSGRY